MDILKWFLTQLGKKTKFRRSELCMCCNVFICYAVWICSIVSVRSYRRQPEVLYSISVCCQKHISVKSNFILEREDRKRSERESDQYPDLHKATAGSLSLLAINESKPWSCLHYFRFPRQTWGKNYKCYKQYVKQWARWGVWDETLGIVFKNTMIHRTSIL